MRHLLALLSVVSLTAAALPARSGRSLPRSERRSERPTKRSERPRSTRCAACERDPNGRIARSTAARREFRTSNPCPATGKTTGACAGYQIDHRVPLSKGGTDDPTNMEWLSIEQHEAKTAAESR
jgi:5-methylcytosine-specific restriction endonuclease McrA